ncbi:S-adenosyl-L-methionine-dependent methyltransferase [Thozetella sp. PMI_491]|nr:S-adenosyl-L-methionine-dependent methyltransferase [Thozetella sp. PMI_491]
MPSTSYPATIGNSGTQKIRETNRDIIIIDDDELGDDELDHSKLYTRLDRLGAVLRSGDVKLAEISREKIEEEGERQERKLFDGKLDKADYEFIDLGDFDAQRGGDGHERAADAATEWLPGHPLDRFTNKFGVVIEKGTMVELAESVGRWGAEFLQVKEIYRDRCNGLVSLRGFLYTRARNMRGMLPSKLNEVCMLVETVDMIHRHREQQALFEIPSPAAMAIRELRVTNAPFPEHRFTMQEFQRKGAEGIAQTAPLVCRFRMYCSYSSAAQRARQEAYEWALVRIKEDEADPEYRVKSEVLVNRWRGGKVVGGAYFPDGKEPVIDLDDPRAARPLVPGQRYLAGDVFCGAGGASRGMERAGLQVDFAIDHWENAAQSYRANFPGTAFYFQDIDEFITKTNDTPRYVDFIHLSPPCQVWSPAHTVAGKNDEANVATLFSCEHIISKCKPRLFTLEQTFGILRNSFEPHFNTLIAGFTGHGYSVRWKIMNLNNYGLVQPRKRVIMFGAGPGEGLPPFPEPTHGASAPSGGLMPLTTVLDILHDVDRYVGHPLHNPHLLLEKAAFKGWSRPPWNPFRTLPFTITCSGGQNYHWSGKRKLTAMEFALLQGFPAWHKFRGSCIIKQIGNAFPPTCVRFLYEYLAGWLDRHDSVQGSRLPVDLPAETEIVNIASEREEYLAEVRRRKNLAQIECDDDLALLDLTGSIELSSDDEDKADDDVSVASESTLAPDDCFFVSSASSPDGKEIDTPLTEYTSAEARERCSFESRLSPVSPLDNRKRKLEYDDEFDEHVTAPPPKCHQRRQPSVEILGWVSHSPSSSASVQTPDRGRWCESIL